MNRQERILKRKKSIGSRTDRKLNTFNDKFIEIFHFFLTSFRKDVLTFCGESVETTQDLNSADARYVFREYDNGRYKNGRKLTTRHSNVLHGVLVGKKAWGLWSNEWANAIAEGSFTKNEILSIFSEKKISIPSSLMVELNNKIMFERRKKYDY